MSKKNGWTYSVLMNQNELPSPEQIARLLEYINEKELKNDI
jgi:hypothetical protein